MSSALPLLPEGRYITIEGGYRMHFLEQGAGEPVVFLHGSGPGASGHSNFKQNYPFLAEHGFRTIVPDHIGYGFSDKPDDVQYHIDFFASAILQLLDDLGVERFVPVGNSLGGAVALKIALDNPERIAKMILMAPGGVEEQSAYFEMPGMAAMRDFFVSGEPVTEESLGQLLCHLVHDPAHITPQLVRERKQVFETQNTQVITTMKVPDMEPRLGELSCPVLAFWGVNEGFMPLTGILKLARGCPDIRVVVQSRCGHWVMVEHRELFNRACLDFLRRG